MKYKSIFGIIFILVAAFGVSAQRCDIYLVSKFGCVDTVRMKCSNFDLDDFPEYDAAFLHIYDDEDGYRYIIKPLAKGESSDGIFCAYRNDWRGNVSGDSLRIVMGSTDSIGMRVIASNVIMAEPEDSSGIYRFFKPDMLTLRNESEYVYLNSIITFPLLTYSDIHYPVITYWGFHEDPDEIRLEPMKIGLVRASHNSFHLKTFRVIRKSPIRRRWCADEGWAVVPLLLEDGMNEFSVRKFGFYEQKIHLSNGEKDSLKLKPWLYFNLPATWIFDTGTMAGPWPSDLVFGVDISGLIPGLYQIADKIGIDYEIVLSPFPTVEKAAISWSYGDLWTSEIYGLIAFDSNPFRQVASCWITEHELSGKAFLGRNVWRYFPIFFSAGYGRGKTIEPSIYKYRFLENQDAEVTEGHGYYISGGFELWFLRSAIIRPTIEAGIAWGGGQILSYDGEIISESDESDDNTFPFIRISLRP